MIIETSYFWEVLAENFYFGGSLVLFWVVHIVMCYNEFEREMIALDQKIALSVLKSKMHFNSSEI